MISNEWTVANIATWNKTRFREYRQLGIKGDIFGSLDEVLGFIDAKLQKNQRIGKIVKG